MNLCSMTRHAAILAVVVASAITTSPLSAQFPTDSVVRAMLQERVMSGKTTGIVVGLVENGRHRVISFGEENAGRPLDGASVFEIGSITKAFTGTLLADMVQRGEVKLDDPVAKYLPEGVKVPTRNGREITLADLASHMSGLPRLPGNMAPKDVTNPYADYTVQNMYDFLKSYALPRDIGERYEYSNLGAGLLGHVLALRAGKTYEALLMERVIVPLAMHSTAITLTPSMRDRLTPGHNARGDVVPNWDMATMAGAGGLKSTVNDMMTLIDANLAAQGPLSKALTLATAPRAVAGSPLMSIGLNWHTRMIGDHTITWHNGGTGGYASFIGFDRANKRGVVVLTNAATRVSDEIGTGLLTK